MASARLDRFLAPWVFVLTGIIFNLLSAVITHYCIGLNNDTINDIDREIPRREVLIDSLWQTKAEIERKQEFKMPLVLSNSRLFSIAIFLQVIVPDPGIGARLKAQLEGA